MSDLRVTIRIVPNGKGFSVPKVPGVSGIELNEAHTIEGARFIASLIEAAAKAKGWKSTVIEEGKK